MNRLLTITLLSLLLAGCAGETADSGNNDEAEPERRVLMHAGLEREYFVYLPPGADDAPVPLVLALHGYTSTATGFDNYHGVSRHAREHGYMLVVPQGTHFVPQGGTQRITSWNDLAANVADDLELPHCTSDRNPYPCPPECGECGRCAWTRAGIRCGATRGSMRW